MVMSFFSVAPQNGNDERRTRRATIRKKEAGMARLCPRGIAFHK